MPDLIFDGHARQAMRRDVISEDHVYHVVGDADDMIERYDGRTEYWGTLEDGRQLVVVVEDDTQIVKTVWWNKRGSRRRRR